MNASHDLTKQESIILALVAQGKRNAAIAQELFLSVNTVESHLYRIFQKLNVSTRTEAAFCAFQRGLLSKPKFTENADDTENRSHYSKVIR